ncbi:MAG: hypothetical protein EBR22_04385 [Cytophagia bacterium]|nr:hypothetical protein [Cytophagia bacterium]
MFRAEVLDRGVKGIALVTHPVWMPLYINGLAWSAGLPALEAYPPTVSWWFTAALALMAVVLPLLALLWMKRMGMISSLEVPEAGQRRSPYTVQALCLGALWWMLADLNLSPWLTRPILCSLILVLWALILLERTKVSAHAMGMGALTAATACLYRQGADWGWGDESTAGLMNGGVALAAGLVPGVVLLSGLVVAARLHSGAHTPAELLHGWGAGLLVMGLGLLGLGPTD